MKTKIVFGLIPAILVSTAWADIRTSASYSISTEVTDAGGRRATSTSYTNDGSVGLVAGISTLASPGTTAKPGYIAELDEIGEFWVAATPSTLVEGIGKPSDYQS